MPDVPDTDDDRRAEIGRRAERLARRLDEAHSFADALAACGAEYRSLLEAVAQGDPRFAFDRGGRPAAVEAVRSALPLMERELFDAILEDHACELAAVEEALYRVVLANGRPSAREHGPG